MTTTLLVPTSVEVKPYDDPFTGAAHATHLVVSPVWAFPGVDRQNTGGIVVTSKRDADRLTAAYLSGRAFESTEVKTDVNGATYVAASCKVMGRYLNSDLKKLGF